MRHRLELATDHSCAYETAQSSLCQLTAPQGTLGMPRALQLATLPAATGGKAVRLAGGYRRRAVRLAGEPRAPALATLTAPKGTLSMPRALQSGHAAGGHRWRAVRLASWTGLTG